MFQVVRVNSRRALALEPLGTKRKFWFRDDNNRRVLFKAEERGTGEDWAEKIACELCQLLRVPHVHYELAIEEGINVPGVICETCSPPPTVMGLGNQCLQALDPNYPGGRRYKVRAHTVDAVSEVLELLLPPPAPYSDILPLGIDSAEAVFAGYTMLDAWIANQDRHHENWAVLRMPGELTSADLHLAPSFDHGASLARNLTDHERQERLTTRDHNRRIPHFVQRARSAFYHTSASDRAMTTFEAWNLFAARAPGTAAIWLEQLRVIERGMIERLFAEVPPSRMSGVCKEFTLQLLLENQRRLLAGASE